MSGLHLPSLGWEAFKFRHDEDKNAIERTQPMPARKRRLVSHEMPPDRVLYSLSGPGLDVDTPADDEDQPDPTALENLKKQQELAQVLDATQSGASVNQEAGVSSNSTDEDATAVAATVVTHAADVTNFEDDEVRLLRLKFAKLVLHDTFPQFSSFPPEIRRMIWRETWDHRTVMISRHIIGTGNKATKEVSRNDGNIDDARDIRLEHRRRSCKNWNLLSPSLSSYKERYVITHTKSSSAPPASLWVCWESRHETLKHFGVALKLSGGRFTVYFNFDRDILYWTLHSSLSAAFMRPDLARLTRVSIPGLSPILPSFARNIGMWDHEVAHPKARSEEDKGYKFPEFKYVWRMLRRWFPALREITIQAFHQCDCYEVTRKLDAEYPIAIEHDLEFELPDIDDFCCSCFNMQDSVNIYYPPIGTSEFDGSRDDDVDRILDYEEILKPVWKDESMVIGTVAAANRWVKDEEVVVKYLAVYNDDVTNLPGLGSKSVTWTLEVM